MVLCGLIAFGGSAVAQSNSTPAHSSDGQCSNRTLHGAYGCSVQGVLLNVPGLPPEATFVAVTTSHFDGMGNLTGTEHAVVNDTSFNPGFNTNSGTYTVNPDCTGTAVVNTPNRPVPLNLTFVVVEDGRNSAKCSTLMRCLPCARESRMVDNSSVVVARIGPFALGFLQSKLRNLAGNFCSKQGASSN